LYFGFTRRCRISMRWPVVLSRTACPSPLPNFDTIALGNGMRGTIDFLCLRLPPNLIYCPTVPAPLPAITNSRLASPDHHYIDVAAFISMLPLGATDPANLSAQACAELGLTRQLEQHCRVSPPPSNGGSAGYPVWYRQDQFENGTRES
jgi:hypothetical protein